MRKLKRVLMIAAAMTALCSMPTMAEMRVRQNVFTTADEESILLPETIKSSIGKEAVVERSKALASAICVITNTEEGIIGIYAETAMFIPVDWAAITVYLEQLNESTNKWVTVETFEKEFTPADTDDGELTRATVSIDVGTQPAGYYYRLRCIHELEYDNGWYEAKSTKTDGVLLTDIK